MIQQVREHRLGRPDIGGGGGGGGGGSSSHLQSSNRIESLHSSHDQDRPRSSGRPPSVPRSRSSAEQEEERGSRRGQEAGRQDSPSSLLGWGNNHNSRLAAAIAASTATRVKLSNLGAEANGDQRNEGRRQEFTPSLSSSSSHAALSYSNAQHADPRTEQMTYRSSDTSQELRSRKESVKRREKSPGTSGRKSSPYRSPQTRGESPKTRGSSYAWGRERPGWDSSVDPSSRANFIGGGGLVGRGGGGGGGGKKSQEATSYEALMRDLEESRRRAEMARKQIMQRKQQWENDFFR